MMKRVWHYLPLLLLAVALLLPAGCFSVKTQHEIKPIHITMDINMKVDRELDNFFGDLDEAFAGEKE